MIDEKFMEQSEQNAKAFIVWLILNGKTEEALEFLAKHYRVTTPKLKIGLPRGRKIQTLGCYRAKDKTIFVLNSDKLKEPSLILHEFYHHLRTDIDLKHRGTEKHANRFAEAFIQAYNSAATQNVGK
jgi:hypothetical protein